MQMYTTQGANQEHAQEVLGWRKHLHQCSCTVESSREAAPTLAEFGQCGGISGQGEGGREADGMGQREDGLTGRAAGTGEELGSGS